MFIITKAPTKTKSYAAPTVAQVAKQLNFEDDFTDDNNYLQELLDTAIEALEGDINADVQNTACTIEVDYSTIGGIQRTNRIMQAPLQTVTKIESTTDGENWTEISATKYETEAGFNSFEVKFLESITATKLRYTFTTGYTDETRPVTLQRAAIIRAADMYLVDRSQYSGQPVTETKAYQRLISKHIRNYW